MVASKNSMEHFDEQSKWVRYLSGASQRERRRGERERVRERREGSGGRRPGEAGVSASSPSLSDSYKEFVLMNERTENSFPDSY